MIHQIKQPNPQQQSFSPSTDVEAKLQQAIPLHQADQFQQTKQRCQQIQRDCPQDAEAIPLLSVIAYQVGENQIVTGLITQATEFNQYMFLTV